MDSERVGVDVSGGIADVVLTRGDRHNGLDAEMFEAIVEAAAEVAADSDVRVAVLSGEGPSFCAGLDFKAVMAGGGLSPDSLFSRAPGDIANNAQRPAFDWHRLEVPVIAAIHGACLGGGLQIALGADIRIATADAKLSVMEIRYGLIPDMSITTSLPDLVGIDVAKELTWTGRMISGTEAHELGLVTRIADDPRAAALELAATIAAQSPSAIRAGKRLFDEAWRAPAAVGLALEEELQRTLIGGDDQVAAVTKALTG